MLFLPLDSEVAALEAPNLSLAGRCAAPAEVPVPPPQRQRLQQALMARSRDPEADLRARIAAARALGDLGDPRFEKRRGADGDYLLPPLVPIEGGVYPLGSDEGLYQNEAKPQPIRCSALWWSIIPMGVLRCMTHSATPRSRANCRIPALMGTR